MGWEPIATGSLAARAIDAVDAITAALAARPPADDPRLRTSLVAGDLGASLVFGYRHRIDPGRGDAELAATRVERAMDAVDPDRPWITSGYTGLAFALEHLGFNLEDDASGDADAMLLAVLRASPPQLGHDWFRGASGFAVHAIERLPRADAAACVGEIVSLLARRAETTAAGACWVTPADQLPGGVARFPAGARSLDPAHGHVGPITALAAACAHGIAADVARPLLARAVDWLWAQRLESDVAWFPAFAGQTTPARAGWCRGDVGIAAALHASARAIGAPWIDRALELGRLAARRAPDDAGVDDAAICHGAAGLVQVFNRLYQASGEAVFRDAAVVWLDRLLAMRGDPATGIAGFVFPDIDDQRGPRRADPSLLFGAAGVALVLLAATSSIEPAWDRLLLMSVRP